MKNSNLVNNTQKANNANGDIKQAGRDIIEHITYPSPQLEEHDPTIDYKITQEVEGERLTFPKLWFVTHNPNPKRYEVYFTIHFIINNKVEHKIKEGLYGGTKSWNLLPHRGIKAPGLSIPKKIIKKYDNKNKLEIRIYCKAKDSKGNNHDLGSQGYIYQSKTNFWYLEP